MKYFGIVLLLFVISTSAQNVKKGRISLTFNGEKIDLPISTVTMEKGKKILISTRAENNNEDIQQLVALNLTLDKLSLDNGDPLTADNFRLEIRTNKKVKYHNGTTSNSGKNFLISFSDKNMALQFSLFEGGEKLTWVNLRSIAMRLNITRIVFENNTFKISGEFYALLKSGFKSFSGEEIAKVNAGKFEIII